MASARSPRRQLAPTVGMKWRLMEFTFGRASPRSPAAYGVRWRASTPWTSSTTTRGFANGGVFPKNGRIIEFGSRVYLGTGPVRPPAVPVAGPSKMARAAAPAALSAANIIRAGDTLQAAMNVLATRIAQNVDPAAAQAELEAQRQKMLESGKDIARAQRAEPNRT
ncbi:hypothetical protein QYE76_045820 [Lolium multiflorum]|uniref:Uncharacterized protein n=1 Tax=Lolium multiflorum TaxID=4521 RepID=A0AAD8TNI6_LOLMU|nr:hypothetical protein QYE76_045820 [Lolium multiflorum]